MDPRRQTLGPLPTNVNAAVNNSANSGFAKPLAKPAAPRASIAPPRVSMSVVPRLSDAGSRQSMAAKRSSVFGATGKGGEKKDPRPLREEKYISQCIEYMMTFLATHGFDVQLKALKSPSGKDFREVLTFLIHQYDPNFKFGEKFEDEVRSYFRDVFCYPFAISKNALQAVGAPHTWPQVLGLLVWLTEFLQYYENVGRDAHRNNFDSDNDGYFYDYLAAAYHKFLQSEDIADLEKSLTGQIEKNITSVGEEVEGLTSKQKLLQQNIANAKAKEKYLPELRTTKANFESDVEKFKVLMEQLNTNRDTLTAKLTHRKAECDELSAAIREATAEKARLQAAVAEQGISPLEVQTMHHQREMLAESLDTLTKQKQEIQQETWTLEMAECKAGANLDNLATTWNERGQRLGLIPSSAPHANNQDFELKVSAKGPSEFSISVDMKAVETTIGQLKSVLSRDLGEAQAALRNAKDCLVHKTEVRAEMEKSLNGQQQKVAQAESSLKAQKLELESEVAKAVAKVEQIELEIRRVKAGNSVAVEASEQEIHYINSRLAEFDAQCAQEANSKHDELAQHIDMLTQHKAKVGEMIKATLLSAREAVERQRQNGKGTQLSLSMQSTAVPQTPGRIMSLNPLPSASKPTLGVRLGLATPIRPHPLLAHTPAGVRPMV